MRHYPMITKLLLLAAALLLAAEPALWLAHTWLDPVYGSHGLPVFVVVVGLALWSLSSQRLGQNLRARRLALGLLVLTALVRLSGQLLAINTLAALALVVDVYALGLLLGLAQRQRALAPGWLALLFAFALPLERIIQRSVGYLLQDFSAAGATALLRLGFADVEREGVRILLAGRDVLVDLPCSGARSLLLLLMLFTVLAALCRPSVKQSLLGLLLTLLAAYAANVVRISLLAIGIALPELGVAVMEAPWHDLIGLLALGLGAVPVLWWALRLPHENSPSALRLHSPFFKVGKEHFQFPPLTKEGGGRIFAVKAVLLALGFVLAAAVIVSLPAKPVDVTRRLEAPTLPLMLAGVPGEQGVLSEPEQAYFTRYGGSAARSRYGSFGLLVVATAAPLRHLHAPDECLTGLGHKVEYQGLHYGGLPTALYRSTDPNGQVWRVAVTFVSERDEFATSVAEAVWRWLQEPAVGWRMVQRITPWQTSPAELEHWDNAVVRALDLPITFVI